jgi:Helitron helicase-like domain at N-terminus
MEEILHASMGENAKIKLNGVIPHFRNDIYWPGWMYLEIESRRIFQNSQRLIRMDKTNRERNRPTGEELLQRSMYGDWNIVNEKITGRLPSFVRTGDTFYRAAEADLSAFVKARSLPQMFVTVTFSERWYEFQAIIQSAQDFLNSLSGGAHIRGVPNPTNFPWEAVEYYYERIYHLRRYLLANPRVSGYGKLMEMVIRYEFQLRQAIHSHMLLWTEYDIEELISRNYIRADVPDLKSR